jgi:cysteine-rich repeat protein
MTRISIAIIATLIVTSGPALARTDAQKCSAFKWKAAGTHARCLLKEDARALKAGKSPDYSACERKLTLKYTRADRKWACEIEDEVANVRDLLEACADGVRITTASGSSLVGVDPGWVCTGPAPGGCTTICGDGITAGNELCDDGNNTSGDGCSADCQSNETCGNGITDDAAGEECDDGNTLSEDGCTVACEIERCGDAIEQPNEVCDDGNDVGGDGCSADCMSDETCGNGITDGAAGEQCDGEESCNPDCSSPDDCDLSGQYSSQTVPIPGGFLFEDDQMGSVLFSMLGGPISPLTYDTRLPGARLFGGSYEMQILSCLPVSISLFQGLDVLTRIGPLPEPSASGAFLDGARY